MKKVEKTWLYIEGRRAEVERVDQSERGKQRQKLQYAQNCAARLIFNRKKFNHVTDLFYEPHWLPVRYRIQYKICLLTYKFINSTLYPHPDELRSLLLTDCSRANRLKILRNILKISD